EIRTSPRAGSETPRMPRRAGGRIIRENGAGDPVYAKEAKDNAQDSDRYRRLTRSSRGCRVWAGARREQHAEATLLQVIPPMHWTQLDRGAVIRPIPVELEARR